MLKKNQFKPTKYSKRFFFKRTTYTHISFVKDHRTHVYSLYSDYYIFGRSMLDIDVYQELCFSVCAATR